MAEPSPTSSLLGGPQPVMPDYPPSSPPGRQFGDNASLRTSVYESAHKAVSSIKPLTNQRYTLALADVHYADPPSYPVARQKQAILGGETLGRRLRGTWRLSDTATGQMLEEKKATVATVPFVTQRGTMIHNGTEYTMSNQLRLRPGAYTRIRENGEVETHANILPGSGPSHHYFLDPDKGTFHLRLGQAKLPLMPLLRAMGATSTELRDAWGPEIFGSNTKDDDEQGFDKVYRKVTGSDPKGVDRLMKMQQVQQFFHKMALDPEVAARTLKSPYSRLDKDAMLTITKKLLAVGRGDDEVDDRDNLAHQVVYGPEDLIAERFQKDSGRLQRKLFYKVASEGNLKPVVANALNKQIEAALLFSGLGNSLEEINPSDIFDKQNRVTRLGEGGIGSTEAIPDEARTVQPSHFGLIDPIRTPESLRAGVDTFFSRGARKGADGRLYMQLMDARTGKLTWRSPQDLEKATIAFPGELRKRTSKRIATMRHGKLAFAPRSEVDFILPTFENAFSPLANLIPLKSAIHGQRLAMGSRMTTQAVPVLLPEAPLVQSGIPGDVDRSFEEEYASHMGAVRAAQSGKVLAVSPDEIKVRYDDGQTQTIDLYNMLPYNRKTFLHNTPKVASGDRFASGQLLARSNYTDDAGTTALGLNARVAYLPARQAGTFEDAYAVSESFAKRATSEHMYQHDVDWSGDLAIRGQRPFVSLFPKRFTKEKLATLDEDGVVKPGTVVQYGDPLTVLAARREQLGNRVHRRKDPGYTDQTETWLHKEPGVVVDVVKTRRGPVVVVKGESRLQIGDKISGRYGDKGTIGQIVADDAMPKDSEGRPFEVLMNPLGMISRRNPAQIIETVLGKIAAKTGKPYKVTDFEDIDDLVDFAEKELGKNGLKDLEDITDGETGRKIPGVLTGNRFIMKLHHMAEHKSQARGTEGSYTAYGEPAKGGERGSKRVGLMDVNALLSHSATEVLRDASLIRGQKNDDYWLAFMQGHTPPNPKVPLVYDKFLADLKGAGINVVSDGGKLNIMALTDRDVNTLAGDREITKGDTVKMDSSLSPIKGGLFDPTLTGGHNGNRWGAIRLAEPMPNPVMEEPIRRVLGLTGKKFEDILAGRVKLEDQTGPIAIKTALDQINLPKSIAVARMQIASGRKTARDEAVRKLGYLLGAQRTGLHPRDWMMTRAPVLPPQFRPVSLMSDKRIPLVADANYLYKELIEANDNLKAMSQQTDDLSDERQALYNSFKAVTGLGDPIHPKLVEKKVRGILHNIFGDSPKWGTVQRRLLSSTVDVVGRAVITPDSNLDMDSVGLPETKAWDIYRNFVVRRLRRRGTPVLEAIRQVKEKTPLARKELIEEMAQRPVIVARAPVLHRFGIMAFHPRLVKDDTLHVSPLVVSGFSADFDGDAVQYHVPVSQEAVQEARERMLPSRNLLSAAEFRTPMHMPSKEFAGGLYHASTVSSKRRARIFRNFSDLRAAFERGDVDVDEVVELMSAR